MNRILSETLNFLKARGDICYRRLEEVHLSRYFTTVLLDDGSVGSCMSYYRENDLELAEGEKVLINAVNENPNILHDAFLIDTLLSPVFSNRGSRELVVASFVTTVVSALSARYFVNDGDAFFSLAHRRPDFWLKGATSALVVGLGGYLDHLLETPAIRSVHICDLLYRSKKQELAEKLRVYRDRHQDKDIQMFGTIGEAVVRNTYDVVSVTGSALCNNTLDEIIGSVGKKTMTILQGQSAAIHPKCLFEAGVAGIATTIKPKELCFAARGDYSGKALRPWLEGGLRWIYLVPRMQVDCATVSRERKFDVQI